MGIWRIEKFKVKHWPKDKYGEFYGGDSYIILNTMENDEGKKSYDVFFWLGAETSQDEAGTAAYKTVELDDYLGDEPVQYREVQGNESKKFLNMFPKVTILEGGVESGFRNVKPKDFWTYFGGRPKQIKEQEEEKKAPDYTLSLHHVSDASGVMECNEVCSGKLDKSKLDSNDAFILDGGGSVFVWI